MKHLIFIFCTLLLSNMVAFGQDSAHEPETYLVVEGMPEFPGGDAAMYKFLYNNIQYPWEAKRYNIQGKVYVRFIIDEKGKVISASVPRGIGYGCDEASLSAILAMPDWEPGKLDGKPVRVQFTIPIHFSLGDHKDFSLPRTIIFYELMDENGTATSVQPDETPGIQLSGTKRDQDYMFDFLTSGIDYPAKAKKKMISGRVDVSFIVEKDGSVDSLWISRSSNRRLEQEVLTSTYVMLDSIKKSPHSQWSPGMKNGKPQRVQVTIPILFELD